jgi:hypothetical protein
LAEVTKGKASANNVNPNLLNFFMFLTFNSCYAEDAHTPWKRPSSTS